MNNEKKGGGRKVICRNRKKETVRLNGIENSEENIRKMRTRENKLSENTEKENLFHSPPKNIEFFWMMRFTRDFQIHLT